MSTTERTNLLAHARSVVEKAKAENRDLTPGEAASVQADLDRVDELDVKRGSDLVRKVLAMPLGPNGERPDPDNPTGSIFTPEAKAGFGTAIRTRTAYRTELDRKTLTSGSLLPPAGDGVVPGLYPFAAVALGDLFANVDAEGPTVRYYRITAGSAEVVAEGQQKPDAGLAVTPVDLPLGDKEHKTKGK
jgi:hypothetical protein